MRMKTPLLRRSLGAQAPGSPARAAVGRAGVEAPSPASSDSLSAPGGLRCIGGLTPKGCAAIKVAKAMPRTTC